MFARFSADYGMVFVLLLLCAYFSAATWTEQHPTGAAAADDLGNAIVSQLPANSQILIIAHDSPDDIAFADALRDRLTAVDRKPVTVVKGQPSDARAAFERIATENGRLDAVACTSAVASWPPVKNMSLYAPSLAGTRIIAPQPYYWPNFLKRDNLLNIADQIAVYAIIAIGMTMVIIAGGIDLSVGSLVALAAVTSTLFIRAAGAESAGELVMTAGCVIGILVCAAIGLISGLLITFFGVPAFIMTLAMMQVASGLAYLLSAGQSVYEVPASFVGPSRNAVLLMAILYALAHVLMTRMTLGRYIYAVGGNAEAARLSGVPVRAVRVFVYTLCGALAGLGGVLTASKLKSGLPTYGQMYELYVIAAVVVGGTSLQGGQGKILGTLIGAFIIAVIQNGMNLTGVESHTQRVVLGLVILGAVLLDQLKKRGWAWWLAGRKPEAVP